MQGHWCILCTVPHAFHLVKRTLAVLASHTAGAKSPRMELMQRSKALVPAGLPKLLVRADYSTQRSVIFALELKHILAT